jgi:tetratricopeptide (TPR) repeat protein
MAKPGKLISPSKKKKVASPAKKNKGKGKASASISKVKPTKAKNKKVMPGKVKAKPAPSSTKAMPAHSRPTVPRSVEKEKKPGEIPKSITKAPVPHSSKGTLIKQYEMAVKLVYSQQFDKAREVLEKIIQTAAFDKDIAERSQSLLRVCLQKNASTTPLRTLDDHYNYGVALMNQGRFQEANDHLQRALRIDPKCDYVLYALAANQCRAGNQTEALSFLKAAIQAKPENRFVARNDSDFEGLVDDPRFTAIIH